MFPHMKRQALIPPKRMQEGSNWTVSNSHDEDRTRDAGSGIKDHAHLLMVLEYSPTFGRTKSTGHVGFYISAPWSSTTEHTVSWDEFVFRRTDDKSATTNWEMFIDL